MEILNQSWYFGDELFLLEEGILLGRFNEPVWGVSEGRRIYSLVLEVVYEQFITVADCLVGDDGYGSEDFVGAGYTGGTPFKVFISSLHEWKISGIARWKE